VPVLSTQVDQTSVVIDVGRMPIRVHSTHPGFLGILRDRYTGFVSPSGEPAIDFDVEIVEPLRDDPGADVEVAYSGRRWNIMRGDFRAEWEPATRRGRIRQTASPYAIDSVLRIVHSLVLAQQGGFLLHSASAIRNGKAFLFMGVSGAGKTTISSLAPANVALLTDEISYVRPQNAQYIAFGTPFTGELAKVGENVSAPIAAAYLLGKGPENRIEPVERGEAARALLANTLFFANDQELVQAVFDSALHFVETVPVSKLTFVPDARVWELIA
jgi:hypothetical protein